MRKKNKELIVKIKSSIDGFYVENGYLPTVREIAARCGASKSNVAQYLSWLTERGEVIKTDGGYATERSVRFSREVVAVPKVGRVPCGPLGEEYEEIEEYVSMPAALVGRGEHFLLTAYGDSMINAGISDGDLVLIKRQEFAHNGDIAVVFAGGEVTLKRFYRDDERGVAILRPENDGMEDITVKDCAIQGVAVKVIKDLT